MSLFAAPAAASSRSDAELRLLASAGHRLADDLVVNLSGQVRIPDNISHLSQIRLGGGLDWQLAPGVNTSVEYGFLRFLPDGRSSYNGHRFSESINYPLAQIGRARLLGRTRLEQNLYDNGADPLHRLRQRVQLQIPLPGPAGLRGILEEEALLQLRARGKDPAGLNQLRTFIGLGMRVADATSLQAGYMNQTSLPGENRVSHVLDLRLSTGF